VKKYEKYGRNPSLIVKRFGKYRRRFWNDMEHMEEKVSQIVIRYGQYGRKSSWNVKWYGKYGRKASRRVIIYGQHRRKSCRIVKK
jgi:hypothetical protein